MDSPAELLEYADNKLPMLSVGDAGGGASAVGGSVLVGNDAVASALEGTTGRLGMDMGGGGGGRVDLADCEGESCDEGGGRGSGCKGDMGDDLSSSGVAVGRTGFLTGLRARSLGSRGTEGSCFEGGRVVSTGTGREASWAEGGVGRAFEKRERPRSPAEGSARSMTVTAESGRVCVRTLLRSRSRSRLVSPMAGPSQWYCVVVKRQNVAEVGRGRSDEEQHYASVLPLTGGLVDDGGGGGGGGRAERRIPVRVLDYACQTKLR
ncbi:hypothetical protein EV126DRAFT_402473 [Verticillium dahliae]|nr:hypothetical protein EV126DRAFT_402473 [Verticillium dahliae]